MKLLFVSDENNKSETVEQYDSLGELNFSSEERTLMNRARNKFENASVELQDEKDPLKNPEMDKSFHMFSDENNELENLMKRAQAKEKVWEKASVDDHDLTTISKYHPELSKCEEDTRERIQKMFSKNLNTTAEDLSHEMQQSKNCTYPFAFEPINRPQRFRRDAKLFQKLYRQFDKRTTTEWIEWRNISGTMKRFPTYIAEMITRNKHFKIVQEAKRKMKKEEIIQRYKEKSEKLRKQYHRGKQYTRGEVNRVKGKVAKEKVLQSKNVLHEFMKPANTTFLHNYANYKKGQEKVQLCDGMSGSDSALYYKDGHNLTTFGFDSEKSVESNYINETLIRKLGLRLNLKERKELNKNLKKFEIVDHETLAPHFYEDYREDIFQNEERIFDQRATPLDLLDGLNVLPYVLREKTLPPRQNSREDNTLEEVIRNCRYLDLGNFRKLGEQKLPRYILKVHDRRRLYRNITRPTTPKDDSVLSRGDEEAFMKRITIKTAPGKLLYDHEKLYDKISRHKFKYKKVIYNDSLCWAYRELTDLAPVYITIVPKKNLTSLGDAGEEDAFLLGHMFHLCSKLAFNLKMRDGYRVVINNGYAGNHNLTHLNIMLIGGRQMRYPKHIYYDLSHFNEDHSAVEHDLSTYGDNFQLSGRMADFFGSYGSLREKRAKWMMTKYPRMAEGSAAFYD